MSWPIFGGAYVRREICVSKSIGLACSGKEIYHFCFVLLCILLCKCCCHPVNRLTSGQNNVGRIDAGQNDHNPLILVTCGWVLTQSL